MAPWVQPDPLPTKLQSFTRVCSFYERIKLTLWKPAWNMRSLTVVMFIMLSDKLHQMFHFLPGGGSCLHIWSLSAVWWPVVCVHVSRLLAPSLGDGITLVTLHMSLQIFIFIFLSACLALSNSLYFYSIYVFGVKFSLWKFFPFCCIRYTLKQM